MRLDRLLAGLGWPLSDEPARRSAQDDAMHDRDWQSLQAWRDALRQLASLDATTPATGYRVAIRRLRQICRERIFQPRSTPANIQVLGLYEVSGLRFDFMWVLGLHNETWPPPASPNPFIPGRLQKKARLPHSSPERELDVARTVTARLLETAEHCVFSYPRRLDDEDVLPSPLLDQGTVQPVEEVPRWSQNDWPTMVSRAPGPQTEPLAMPGPLRYRTARGGSSILKNQALCPFRSFASNRLGAEHLETPPDGISPALHGSLVHNVLEQFWKETRTLDALLAMDEETLADRVREHIETVTNEEHGLRQRPAFRTVEAGRVFRHVMEYLALEKEREDFEVVGQEKEVRTIIGGQEIRLYIDRLDQLASGDQVVIDYKTGKVDPRKWFGDRPEDPQMPLYAINAEHTPAAVVFGIVRDDGCLFKGVVRTEGLLPGLPQKGRHTEVLVEAGEDMPGTVERWREVLHRLMSEFLAGEAAIDPKEGPKTCDGSYCNFQSLCRIGELAQTGMEATT
jgi:probable DNA repair protein